VKALSLDRSSAISPGAFRGASEVYDEMRIQGEQPENGIEVLKKGYHQICGGRLVIGRAVQVPRKK
jgi:hypothetical protein